VTTKLDTFTFPVEPEIRFEREHNIARKEVLKKFGTSKEWMGASSLRITLTGRLSGSNCYTDRDSLLSLFATKNSPVNFYSDTIDFGSDASPKSVWLVSVVFIHPRGAKSLIDYTIVLEEDNP
jgi:hypothetical protein